ncbi:IPT/TIG domain protein [Oceanobacillus sp. 143]|uniref:IPT/TIG domain protein n=1 Tax=Oceanobacillus zhaokaii TaxID=2052660 RepID=A0A345PLS2_9BACI|nr:IPT/TIG domain protein [Oceanobacillus zhaokaii]AXI10952.1 IPT/TIG domain protein [Oceanobacillus zhaokaii]QGS69787.1 IPT/TIG domain protein [Oceanobacillus sp. 143]
MEVGPIRDFDGFPVWYRDENGLRLQLNINPNDPFSGLTPADLPNPNQAVSFPDNYPGEAFYFSAEAEMETGTRERARLVLALEAAFANEVPRDGDQIVFGRVRIRVDGLRSNEEYRVTHPYGVDTFIAEPDGDGFGEINFTEDIGISPGNFELVLDSRIDPFLRWDPNVEPQAPAGYIGNPDKLHPIVGSEFIDQFGEPQNIFRIEGPGIGIGSPDRATTPGLNPDNVIETRNFSLLGKISTISGVDVERTTYTQDSAIGGVIDVFASSDVGPQQIEVSGEGLFTTRLQGGNGLYFARVSYSGESPPSFVTITNITDNPPSVKESIPVDFISASAIYNNDTQILTIEASTSDSFHPIDLTVADFGQGDLPIPSDGLQISLTNIPANITIQSSAGGNLTIPITVVGSPVDPNAVSANAGSDQTVIFGTAVTLDGTASTGPITSYQWVQLSGPTVTLVNADTAAPSFIAPETTSTFVFQLTVEGEGGPSSDTVSIEVIEFAPEPIVDAGPDQQVQQGSLVTLSGSITGDVTTFLWEQISGPPVEIINADTPIATFNFPKQLEELTFRFTVTGPGGQSSDTMAVTTLPDNLTVNRVEFRTRDTEWRISGTSNVAGPGVFITIYIGNTLNGNILAEVPVNALGEWEYRIEPSSVQPNETRAISIQSSSGGTIINVPITIRQ